MRDGRWPRRSREVGCKADNPPRLRLIPWEAKAKGHYREARRRTRRSRLRRQPCSRRRTKGSGVLDRETGIRQPTALDIDPKAYPLASGSSGYGTAGHYCFGGQTLEIAAKPWPCRDISRRVGHTTSWPPGASGISLWVNIKDGWYYSARIRSAAAATSHSSPETSSRCQVTAPRS